MHGVAIWLTCWSIGAASVAAAESPAFSTAGLAAPAGARGAVSADFNGDGWIDIATANTGRNTVAVFLNAKTAGRYLPPFEIEVGAGPFAIAAGDLNRDGTPDIVVTTPDSGAGTLEILLMGSDARPLSHRVATIGQARGVALADVNRDGILDIVYAGYTSAAVFALRGDGLGGFTSDGSWPVGSRPQGVAAGDFNHDGLIDLAVAINGVSAVDVLYGSATGFTRRSVAVGRTTNVLSTADIDLDGWDDIAAVSTDTDAVAILRGGPTGFALAGARHTGPSPRGIASGDFNRDGHPDFAVSNRSGNSVTVLLSQPGTVLPTPSDDLAAGSGARGIVAGDFNNDGRIDIAAAAEFEPQLTLFSNRTTFITTGFSFHEDRVAVSGPDTRTVAADLNHNGKPDLLANGFALLDDRRIVNVEQHSPSFVFDVAAADYDRDGHLDVVMAVQYSRPTEDSGFEGVEVYRGDGNGGFTLIREVAVAGAHQVRVADLNRDGRSDLVVAGTASVSILLQGVSGSIDVPVASYPSQIETADVNRDDRIDVLVSHRDPSAIETLIGDGRGRLSPTSAVKFRLPVEQFVVADFNHDGRVDLAMESAAVIFVALATPTGWTAPVEYPTVLPHPAADGLVAGDFNNDGQVDLVDSTGTMLRGTGSGRFGTALAFDFLVLRGTPVDWNGDGLLDIGTLYDVIVNDRNGQNHPPVADAGADFSLEYKSQFTQPDGPLWAGNSSDPDLHRLTYQWTDDETGRSSLFVTPAATMPPKPPGTHAFTLTVFDGRNGQASDDLAITITPTQEIVVYPAADSTVVGNWQIVDDPSAAAGARLFYPNANASKVTTALAEPASYVEVPFVADPTQTYKLWVRLKAQNNAAGNDSIWLQFSGSVDTAGQPAYRIGTTGALPINLEECSGCGISGWGWEDDGWGGMNVNGTVLRFPAGGVQKLRIQVREDGVSLDQIVLSAVTYRTRRPGSARNDTVIVPLPRPPE